MNTLGDYELNQIYTGDCRELCRGIPDQSVKLAFADPPYWVNFKYANGKTDAQMDYIEPVWLVEELQRIAQVVLITSSIGFMYQYPQPRWVIAWHKPAAMGRNVAGGVNAWEPILLYGKSKINIDVLTVQVRAQPEAAFHSCPKPLKLMQQIIEYYTSPGDIVFDPLCGSATTCVAAKMAGRRWLGFELDPAIAEQSRRRVANAQPPLLVLDAPEQMTLEYAV